MKGEIRRANIYHTLKKLHELAIIAMNNVDANYWQKCIKRMFREVAYYMAEDGLTVNSTEMCSHIIKVRSFNPYRACVRNLDLGCSLFY